VRPIQRTPLADDKLQLAHLQSRWKNVAWEYWIPVSSRLVVMAA
jgi:hypothetical protein